ncbi:MAG: hypothetical protein AB7P02_15925 [Alphaproteobacteria bacterium]
MAAHGARPVLRQHVRSEAKGVLTLAPEAVRRVALSRGGERLVLERAGETGWRHAGGGSLDEPAAKKVSTAILMLHRSAPVREIGAAELAGVDTAPYGLEPPRIVAALYADGEAPVLVARFGGRNPDDFLQYMRIDGDPRLLLMSRFIGEEWAGAMDAATAR